MLIFKTGYQYWEDWKFTLDPLPRARFVRIFSQQAFAQYNWKISN